LIDAEDHLSEDLPEPMRSNKRNEEPDQQRCNLDFARTHDFLHQFPFNHFVKHVIGDCHGNGGRGRKRSVVGNDRRRFHWPGGSSDTHFL
jgi:hypothetical protein